MPRLFVDRITIPNPDTKGRTCDDALNDYLSAYTDVTAVQHIGALYATSADVVSGKVQAEVYLLTRTSA